ncbi:MAG: glycoside hydrolase/deacetylase, partial [Paenibacillus sp.]|nr:glycoside hydrolase/deacetylase [Paenibacillus sp.]
IWERAEWMRCRPPGVTLLPGSSSLPVPSGEASAQWQDACRSYCEDGNALLALGDDCGLPGLLGIRIAGRLNEGWIQWGQSAIAEGISSSFHVFDAVLAETDDSDRCGQGRLLRRRNSSPVSDTGSPAFVTRKVGRGAAAMFGFDMMKTCCLIQQGLPVIRDGIPAADGSAAIDDGILKTDDGSVLDMELDRHRLTEDGVPFFLHPTVDEMRIVLVRAIYDLHESVGVPGGQVWFWPEGLPAIGHISHDTDGHIGPLAEAMLDRLREADIRSTWCHIMPGYPQSIYEKAQEDGHEMAFHYNALGTEMPESRWSEQDARFQLDMLRAKLPGVPILTNKNHFLRWEGDVQFYRWCERSGIVVEQSKGGTKQGNKGFLFGTCHPYRPMDTAEARNRLFPLVSLPTLAWDPPIPARATEEEARALLRRCLDVYGVAHFLFHPGAIHQGQAGHTPGDVLVRLCEYGRECGMAWWTAQEIWEWLQARRGVQLHTASRADGSLTLTVTAEQVTQGVTLLVWRQADQQLNVSAPAKAVVRSVAQKRRFGRDCGEIVLDVPAGQTELTVS